MGERDENERSGAAPDETGRSGTPSGGPAADTEERKRRPPPGEGGLEREVGDLEDPDAEKDDGALPGRAGGGLAGG